MQTVRVEIKVEGGGSVAADLPAEDVLNGLIYPAMRECDDGEWTWHMQENHLDRLEAVEALTRSAHELIGVELERARPTGSA